MYIHFHLEINCLCAICYKSIYENYIHRNIYTVIKLIKNKSNGRYDFKKYSIKICHYQTDLWCTLPVLCYHLHPAGWIDFHQCIWYVNYVHSIKDAGKNRMPETNFSFKIQDAYHIFTFCVIAGHGKHPTVLYHGCASDRYTHYRAISICTVFYVSWSFICQPGN